MLRSYLLSITLILLLLSDNSICSSTTKQKKQHRKKGKPSPPPPPAAPSKPGSPSPSPASKSNNSSTTFNVLDYGAKGNGIADDTSAFSQAWSNACEAPKSVVLVPSGFVFLVKPVTFSGVNCIPNIVFQLDGRIIAPTDSGSWGPSGLLQWLDFTKITKGMTIQGKGIIDGQGSVWWNEKNGMPSTKPTALRFYGSTDVTVTGITIQNSPQTHLKFDSCDGVEVFGLTASSPGDSPNTDGIHLQNSQDVLIYATSLACGDDCISIQTGCSRVYVHNVNCGPGHGISIGGLGKDGTKACVSNITVRDTTLQNTMNGVRIKTWQGGSGSVKEVTFSNIQVSNVNTPIIIDQYYCEGHSCPNKTSAVSVLGINYQSIKGTYSVEPVYFACSDSTPCEGLTLSDIDLEPSSNSKGSSGNNGPFCWKAFGQLETSTTPPVGCLGKGSVSPRTSSGNGGSC